MGISRTWDWDSINWSCSRSIARNFSSLKLCSWYSAMYCPWNLFSKSKLALTKSRPTSICSFAWKQENRNRKHGNHIHNTALNLNQSKFVNFLYRLIPFLQGRLHCWWNVIDLQAKLFRLCNGFCKELSRIVPKDFIGIFGMLDILLVPFSAGENLLRKMGFM